jgi:nicotinate phosphoribosyltransferase
MNYLNQDTYKITMKMAVWTLFPNVWVRYRHILRTKGVDLRPLLPAIQAKIDEMQGLGPTSSEIEFLRAQGYLNPSYLVALSNFRLNPNAFVHLKESSEYLGGLELIIEGPWYDTIDFEVPILQMVSEAYTESIGFDEDDAMSNLAYKVNVFKDCLIEQETEQCRPFYVMEFGTRRSATRAWHDKVVEILSPYVGGTSNMHLALKYDLKPLGTMAHEYISAHGALYPLQDAQRMALMNWNHVFRGDLGTALTDTFGFDQFLRDFDKGLANLYTGVRHDSGDPYDWADKMLDHYRRLKIDPQTKILTWSDGLNFPQSVNLWRTYRDQTMTTFGIGTDISNDWEVPALSQVIKLTHVGHDAQHMVPVIKISDEPNKVTCDDPVFRDWAIHLFTEILK